MRQILFLILRFVVQLSRLDKAEYRFYQSSGKYCVLQTGMLLFEVRATRNFHNVKNHVRRHRFLVTDDTVTLRVFFHFLISDVSDAWPTMGNSATENPVPELRSQNCASRIC